MALTLLSLMDSDTCNAIKAAIWMIPIPQVSMENTNPIYQQLCHNYLPSIPTLRWLNRISLIFIHNHLDLRYHLISDLIHHCWHLLSNEYLSINPIENLSWSNMITPPVVLIFMIFWFIGVSVKQVVRCIPVDIVPLLLSSILGIIQ